MFRPLPGKVFFLFMLFITSCAIFGIIYLNNLFNAKASFLKVGALLPLTTTPSSISLNLSSPSNNSLVFEADLLIDGQTSPNATVLITTEDSDKIIEANNKGYFSFTAKLSDGINQFQIIAFDNYGNTKQEARSVYYSKEKI